MLTGEIQLERLGEPVVLDIEQTPLSMDEFPQVVLRVVERVELVTEVIDSSMPHFPRNYGKIACNVYTELWRINRLLKDDDDSVDCFAGALHQVLELSVYGRVNDDDVEIHTELRTRFDFDMNKLAVP